MIVKNDGFSFRMTTLKSSQNQRCRTDIVNCHLSTSFCKQLPQLTRNLSQTNLLSEDGFVGNQTPQRVKIILCAFILIKFFYLLIFVYDHFATFHHAHILLRNTAYKENRCVKNTPDSYLLAHSFDDDDSEVDDVLAPFQAGISIPFDAFSISLPTSSV